MDVHSRRSTSLSSLAVSWMMFLTFRVRAIAPVRGWCFRAEGIIGSGIQFKKCGIYIRECVHASGERLVTISDLKREQKLSRYRYRKKKIKYACRKAPADSQPRVRGRFAKMDDGDILKPRKQDQHKATEVAAKLARKEDKVVARN